MLWIHWLMLARADCSLTVAVSWPTGLFREFFFIIANKTRLAQSFSAKLEIVRESRWLGKCQWKGMQQQQQQQCQKKQTHNKTKKKTNSLQTPLDSFPCPTMYSLRKIALSKLISLSQWKITLREESIYLTRRCGLAHHEHGKCKHEQKWSKFPMKLVLCRWGLL